AADDARLPGSGDELRTLFGAVVGDPAPAPAPPPPAPVAPTARGHQDGNWNGDYDPLGPPTAKPPIDLHRLDDAFEGGRGAPRADRSGAGTGRRTPTGDGAYPRDAVGGAGTATPPARSETWPEQADRAGRWPPPETAAGPTHAGAQTPAGSRPPPVAPAPTGGGRKAVAAANAGPPALPVIVLVAVVAILTLGIAFIVISGHDAAEPASDNQGTPVTAPMPTGV